MKWPRNSKRLINYFLGPALLLFLSWSIYREISRQPDLAQTWLQIRSSFYSPRAWLLGALFLLMVLNWSLEAIKWRISVKPVQSVSFSRALQAVLSGVSFSVGTPNRIGEYLGRVLYMDEGNRLRTISLTMVSSLSQLIVTIGMGLAGLLWMKEKLITSSLISPLWYQVILYGTGAALLVLVLLYFRLPFVFRRIDRLPAMKRFVYLVQGLESFDASVLWQMLSLSGLRFAVFILQYGLAFAFFDVAVSPEACWWSVSLTFLVMAVIPTIAVAELAQRGKISLAVIGLYSANELGITFSTALIWLVNLIIPAIAGSILIVRIKKIFHATAENTPV